MAAGTIPFSPVSVAERRPSMHAASEKPVRQSHANIRQLSGLDQTVVAERVVAFLKRKHPDNTAKVVARQTDISRDTVAKWIERGSAPNAEGMARLICVYRTDFLIAVLGGADQWLAVAAWHERRATYEAEQAAFVAEMGPVLDRQGEP